MRTLNRRIKRLPIIADCAWECKKRRGHDLEMDVIWIEVQCTFPYNEEGLEMCFSCHADLALAIGVLLECYTVVQGDIEISTQFTSSDTLRGSGARGKL